MRAFERRLFAAAFTTVLTFCSAFASAAEPLPGAGPVLSRADSLERLKRENLALVAARHRLTQSRADVVVAGVWTNPNITVNGLFATHGAVTGGSEEVSFSVDQVIPIAGQVGLRKDFARGMLTADERAYAANVWDVMSDAKIAYVDLQRAQARWRVVRAGIVDLTRVETVVTARAAAGANAAYDRIRVDVERSKLEGRLAQSESELLGARAILAQAIGQSIDARTVTVEDAIEDTGNPPLPAEVDALVKRALANRPDVGSARARADAGDLRVAYLRRQVVPSPDVSIGYIRFIDAPGAFNGRQGGAMLAGVSFPIPLLDRGQGTIERGLAIAAEDRARKDAVELGARRDIERTVATMAVRVATWRRFRDTTSLDIDKLRTIGELSYREGRATILELLDAYASYVDAQERRVELQAAATKAALDVERAVGPAR
jgi:cobalt-zinc-cadmium efflux system outer membrane protein